MYQVARGSNRLDVCLFEARPKMIKKNKKKIIKFIIHIKIYKIRKSKFKIQTWIKHDKVKKHIINVAKKPPHYY